MFHYLLKHVLCENKIGSEERTGTQKERSGTQKDLINKFIYGKKHIISALAAQGDSCKFGSLKFFLLCGVGGAICCGGTHVFVLPLDLIKCRMQVDPAVYTDFVTGFKVVISEEGWRGLVRGWAPTMIGYSTQGSLKFGWYEVFKIKFKEIVGEENAYLYRTLLYLIAAGTAEVVGDVFLVPMESVKVKVQTTKGYPSALRVAAPKMYREEGLSTFVKSFVPLCMRQVPYTMVKFAFFERILEYFYKVLPKPRDQCSILEQLAVTFSAGYCAGIFATIASHPGDVLVSKMNQKAGATAASVYKELGFMGLWGGLLPRTFMIGTLTAMQWFIYDSFKVLLRIPRPPPPEMPASLKKKLGQQKWK